MKWSSGVLASLRPSVAGALLLGTCGALLLGACGASTPPPVVEPEPTAEEREATCNAHVARYREILSSAPNTCTADTDCAVYGGLDPDAICGGLTDAETARALTAVSEASTADGCPRPGYSCPSIEIHCTDGACR